MRVHAGVIGLLAVVLSVPLLAQEIVPSASIVDMELGWVKVYNFKPVSVPLKVEGRVYSPAQRTIAADLANWMQASYKPIGGLGDVVPTFPKMFGAEPQSYGVSGKIHTLLKYGANRAIERYTGDHFSWNIMVNGRFGTEAEAIATPERYYFTIPTMAQHRYSEAMQKAVDLSDHPFLAQFPAWLADYANNGTHLAVLLTKDRRLPFVKLTRGEYLDAVGVAIAREFESDKRILVEGEQGNKERIARGMPAIEARHAKRLGVLEANRARYKSRLQEAAEISTLTPDIKLEGFADVFEANGSGLRLPVYMVDAATLERCKSDTPQWVVVEWSTVLHHHASKNLHDAVLSQFDFEYIYNRFFDPEKVKGVPYAPVRTGRVETAAVDASAASKAFAADPGVYFFEDFSTTPVGKPPINWRSSLSNTGASSVVVERTGLSGHWLSLSGFTVTPRQLKGPLPSDFTVSFDLVAARDYTWGARGMSFKLSKGFADSGKDSVFSVRLRPGFDARDGEAAVEGKFPGAPGPFSHSNGAPVPGFSNTQQNNRIAVSIRKQGEMVQVFIGRQMIAEDPKAIPASLQFDAVTFDLGGTGRPNDQMFVSNIKITKQ